MIDCLLSKSALVTNNLLLADPANILSSFSDTIENASNTLNLSCTFEGIPTPQIHWYIIPTSTGEEQQLSNSERITIIHVLNEDGNSFSELIIDDLHKNDEGNYTCRGINGVENLIGSADSSEGFLTIYGRVNLFDHVCQVQLC